MKHTGPMQTIHAFDPARLSYEDMRPRFPVEAALCFTSAAATGLGGGFVRLDGPMLFNVDYDEAIYVVSGTLSLRRGGESATIPAGTSALISAGGEVEYGTDGEVLFFFVRHPRQ